MIASFWSTAAEHVFSFAAGVLLGFVISDRYRIVRRNGKGDA
jgi:hypothetical protein